MNRISWTLVVASLASSFVASNALGQTGRNQRREDRAAERRVDSSSGDRRRIVIDPVVGPIIVDVRQEDRRADRREDRQADRQEDRRNDRRDDASNSSSSSNSGGSGRSSSNSSSSSSGGSSDRRGRGADDGPSHDVNDDRGGRRRR